MKTTRTAMDWRRDIAALVVIALIAAIFFWPVLLGEAWIPRGGGDSVSFIYPMYRFAAEQLHSGTIPLWNPHQYAGAPFLADNQSGIFYPLNLLLFFLVPGFSYRAIELLVIFHVFLAGAGTYFCLRLLEPSQPLHRGAAVLGGVAYMFSGVFVTHIGNLNLIAVAAWLPLIFLALHRALAAAARRTALAWAIGGGLLLGIGTLAGHGQMTFLLGAFVSLYAVYRSITERHLRPLVLVALLGLVGIGLAAISLLPAAEAVQHTVRADFATEQANSYALPPAGLLGLTAPHFFGRGEVEFWGGWARVEYGYIGVITLFLAGVALTVRRERLTWFLVLSTLLFLALALGPYTPLYPLLLRLMPWFPFQVPARFVLLADFSLALLAAFGADSLIRQRPSLRHFLPASALAALAVAVLLWWQYSQNIESVPHHSRQMVQAVVVFMLFAAGSWLLILARKRSWLTGSVFAVIAVAWLSLDLVSLGRYVEIEWNDPMPGFAAGSPALEYVKSDPGIHRLDIATGGWQPNMPQMEGLYSIEGVYNPLELANYAAYIGSVGFRGSTLYNLLGTKYVIGGKKNPPGDTNFIVPVFDEDPQVTVFLNTRALPRALVVHNATVVGDRNAAFAAVHEESFDPTLTVILEEGQPLAQRTGTSTVSVLQYDANRAAFEVTSNRDGYFVLSDIYHPDWQATVDGVAAPIVSANYALRAVPISAGTQRVEMWFAPRTWPWGVSVTTATLLAAGLFFLWHRRQQSTISPIAEMNDNDEHSKGNVHEAASKIFDLAGAANRATGSLRWE